MNLIFVLNDYYLDYKMRIKSIQVFSGVVGFFSSKYVDFDNFDFGDFL